jgi:sugar transferase (PEP-CTERM/EpsH1 system associated)
MAKKRKILFISPKFAYPPTGGGEIRIYNLIKALSLRGNQITYLAFGSPEPSQIAEMERYCDKVIAVPEPVARTKKRLYQLLSLFSKKSFHRISNYSPVMQKEINKVLSNSHFDIVQIEFSQMGFYIFPTSAKLVLSEHNIEFDIFHRIFKSEKSFPRKFYNLLEYSKFKIDEIALWEKYDGITTTSIRDKEVIKKYVSGMKIEVIPNGVDTSYFKPAPTNSIEKALVFTGTMDYYPNVDGMAFFIREILPIILKEEPDLKLYIVGKNPPSQMKKFENSNIVITGFVNDIRPFVQRAAVYVVPLRVGGGTRLKILEAMAMEKPVVSTPIGCEGLEVEDEKNILIASDPHSFASYVLKLLRDATLRMRLGREGRQLVESKYDWLSISEKLESFYDRLFESPKEKNQL